MEGHRRPREDAAARTPGLTDRPVGRAGLARLVRSWGARVAVRGHSMSPALRDGDWLLVDPAAFQSDVPGIGDLVVARSEGRLLIKRVVGLSPTGQVQLSGDAPSMDGHRHDTIVALSGVEGRPWFRYWPPTRIGRVR